ARARNFSTNELFTLSELELPSPGGETLRTNSSFGTIEMVFGARASRSGEHIDVSLLNIQTFRSDFANADARWVESLAATDDRGRSCAVSSSYHSQGVSVFHVQVSADAKKLVLTAAAPRIRFVEYTIGRENISRPRQN